MMINDVMTRNYGDWIKYDHMSINDGGMIIK